jgi:hypothetical protein
MTPMKYSALVGAVSLWLVSAAAHAPAIRFYNALAQSDVATLQALGRSDYIRRPMPPATRRDEID